MIPRIATEEVLVQWAREKGVDLRYGMTVDDVHAETRLRGEGGG